MILTVGSIENSTTNQQKEELENIYENIISMW